MEKIFLYRQLGVMLGSGVPIVKAFESAADCCKYYKDKQVWYEAAEAVSRGESLTQIWSSHPSYFEMIETGLIRAGEASCSVAEICLYISEFFSFELYMKRRLKGALQYPCTVCCIFVALSIVMSVYIMPSFSPIFSSITSLPWPTSVLLFGLNMLQNSLFWIFFGVCFLGISALFKLCRWSALAKRQGQILVLHIPLLGKIVKNIVTARFCHTMAMLVRSGLPLNSSLQLVGLSLDNYPLAAALELAALEIEEGAELRRALQSGGYFSSSFISALNVGTESSCLDNVLDRLSHFYNDQIKFDIDKLSVLIEPILLALMGGITAAVLFAMFAPLYEFIYQLV
ncbi:MAG: type II secretion system F family protein [Candidatus Bruticola sp.]